MSLTRVWKLVPALLVCGATVSGAGLLARPQGADGPGPEKTAQKSTDSPPSIRADDTPVVPVKSGTFRVAFAERGHLEANTNADVYNEIPGQTTILSMVPEGTHVKKGQLVAELDSAALRDRQVNQKAVADVARKAEDTAKAEQSLAELALKEYEQGTYPAEWQAARGELLTAELAFKSAQERLARTQEAKKKLDGAVNRIAVLQRTPENLLAELEINNHVSDAELGVTRAKLAVETAQTRLKVLQELTREKVTAQLKVQVTKAREIERAKAAAHAQEISKLEALEQHVKKSKLLAPADGTVVYANDPNRFSLRDGQTRAQIEEGATVRERQKLFSIPDLSKHVVIVKFPEAWVDQLAKGQKVKVRVDAFPDLELTGTVESIAPLPDPTSFFNNAVKVYTTRIALDASPKDLRPGMTVSADIAVDEIPEALTVPVASVVALEGKTRVAVKNADGTFSLRDVTLGRGNDRHVQVKGGLKAGDSVALDPTALLTDEQKATIKARNRPAPKAKGKARAKNAPGQ